MHLTGHRVNMEAASADPKTSVSPTLAIHQVLQDPCTLSLQTVDCHFVNIKASGNASSFSVSCQPVELLRGPAPLLVQLTKCQPNTAQFGKK